MGVLFDVNTSRMVASTAAVLACAVIGDRVPVRYVLAGLALLLAGALILLATETPGSRFIFGVLSGIAMGEARPSVFRPGVPISDARASPP